MIRLLGNAKGGRIAVFRALQLGDLLCAGPALRALRNAVPEAHLTLIGLAWSRELAPRLGFDAFFPFPGFPGLPETPFEAEAFPGFLASIRRERFDLILQMHGDGTLTNPLVALMGARQVAGFYQPGHYCPSPDSFLPYPAQLPEVWRHLALMRHLGIPASDDRLQLCIDGADHAALEALLSRHRINRPYLCIHPGARAAWRRWPAERYAAVGDALTREGWQVIVTGSTAERGLAEAVVNAMEEPASNFAGATADIGLLAALVKGAGLMICGDTGLAHLSVAVDCPSVLVFMRSEREGWTPLDRVRHRVVTGLDGVSPEQVIEAALSQSAVTSGAHLLKHAADSFNP